MNHFFEKARERIQKINWSYKEPSKPSHAILVSEFITHGNLFMDYCNYDPNNRRAIFIATKICEIELPIDAKSECIELNEIKDGWAKMISTFYLEWSFLIDQNFPASLKFKELYDPIIKLYERGGRISYHNNELISGKYGWPRNSALILENNPLRCYSDELLDEVDNGWHYKQFFNNSYLELIDIENYKEEEVAEIILEQLKNSNHSFSNMAIILTALGEVLLNNSINSYVHLDKVKSKLEQFNINDLNVLLPESEKKDLSIRIKQLLSRLEKD